MPHLDGFLHYIVPLTFLAIWALTSLFNREAQPLPPRTVRPPGPPDPKPGTKPSGYAPATTGRGDPSLRWSSPTAGDRPATRRPVGRPDDEILIIEETRRPAAQPPGRTNLGGSRRGTRSRPVPPSVASKRPEPASLRPLSGALGPSVPIAQQMGRPLELNPLSMPASPLMGTEARNLSKTVSEPTRMPDRPIPVTDDFRLLLSTPAKLREAIIVNEILQPPLALRRRSV
jgi:hypothetical protein